MKERKKKNDMSHYIKRKQYPSALYLQIYKNQSGLN
jgi:hypothetical protein